MGTITIEKMVEALRQLPADRQEEALDFIEFLKSRNQGVVPPKRGRYAKYFGTLPADLADRMEQLIYECCEQVDLNEWLDLPRH